MSAHDRWLEPPQIDERETTRSVDACRNFGEYRLVRFREGREYGDGGNWAWYRNRTVIRTPTTDANRHEPYPVMLRANRRVTQVLCTFDGGDVEGTDHAQRGAYSGSFVWTCPSCGADNDMDINIEYGPSEDDLYDRMREEAISW